MGRQIIALAEEFSGLSIVAHIDLDNHRTLRAAMEQADVLIDFSSPKGALAAVAAAGKARVPAVVGTTGFTPAQTKRLKSHARRIPLLLAPNCSPGMNLLFELARKAAASLPSYDAVISETHHTRKKDAPSGSAKRLAEAVREGRRGKSGVATVSLRAGDIIGDHTLLLAGPDERLELSHQAQARSVFARGALEAAVWISRRRPGLYTMKDLLGL